jgi:prepilin-type N-terminal cleavage/methylation domain-containing protein
MNRRSYNFSHIRRGTTLVEVIAALVILGTILSALLIARGRFSRQKLVAQRRLEAVHALDQLIDHWMTGPASAVPVQSSGALSDSSNQIWRMHLVPNPAAARLGTRVVRVDVIDPSLREPILTLDLLLPVEKPLEVSQ